MDTAKYLFSRIQGFTTAEPFEFAADESHY